MNKNKFNNSFFIKNGFIFSVLMALAFILPDAQISDWIGISFKKITILILAVSSIQLMGIVLLKKMNSHAGVIIYGFFAGILSSTALTISLARKSKQLSEEETSVESISFLSATLAMSVQAIILMLITSSKIPFLTLSMFIFPIIVTIILIFQRSIHTKDRSISNNYTVFSWFNTIKLAFFICFILIFSHAAKVHLGDQGLKVVTFLISLFEIHGAIVANTQMYVNQELKLEVLNQLIAISILSSYFAKLLIIYFIGSKYLKRKVTIWSLIIISGLSISFFIM